MAVDQRLSDQALTTLQNDIIHEFGLVKGQLSRLNALIDNIETAWQGAGAGAFNKTQSKVNLKMVEIGKLLLKFQEAIQASQTIKGNTEDGVIQALHGIDVVDGYSGDSGAEARMTSGISKL